MNLTGYDDNENEVNEGNRKSRKVVLFSIIGCTVLVVILLILMIYITYLDSKKLKVYVDNKQIKISNTLFKYDNNGNIAYVSIKELAALTGYTYYNGEYGEYTEEKDSCYIKNDYEAVSFATDSDVIKKYIFKEVIDESNSNNTNASSSNPNTEKYESLEVFEIENKVELKDDLLYIPWDLVKTGFNVYVTVDGMKIRMYTLDALAESYNKKVTQKGYDNLSPKFKNKRALIDDMLIVVKDGQYAVLSLATEEEIVGRKYDDLEYIQNTKEFIVKANGYVGLLSSKGETKITPNKEFNSIELLDVKQDLYIVKQNNKYGVLSGNGKVVIPADFEKIGIEDNNSVGVNNSKLFFNNIIPVVKNNKWGFYDANGKVLLDTNYDTIGYTKQDDDPPEIKNTVLIPKEVGVEGIIICLDKKYGIINSEGKLILGGCVYSKIYAETSLGETEYYCEFYGEKMKLSDQLK